MKKLILILSILQLSFSAEAQSGYLGSLNGFALDIEVGPSYRRTFSINSAQDEGKQRLRYANMSYTLSYARVISKTLEVKAGYNIAFMKAFTQGSYYRNIETIPTQWGTTEVWEDLNFLHDPRMTMHSFNLEVKKYRQGSLAPTGKFLGGGFQYGVTNISSADDIIIGKRDVATKESFFGSKHDILESQALSFPSQKVSYVYLYGMIGRNYPLTQNLLLTVSTSFPIYTFFMSDIGGLTQGFDVSAPNTAYDPGDNLWRMMNHTIKQYRRIVFDIGIQFHI